MNDRRPMKMVQKISFLCCQFCSYKTRFTGNLAKHIRTHTGERPFKCQFCGKGFASKSNYNTHVVIHTPGVSPSGKLPSSNRLAPPQPRLRRSSLHRQYTTSEMNADIVRNMPVVKTLLSSNRSSQRSSASQQLSPIGSFLMPDRINSSYSHTALYSSINFASFNGALASQNDSALDSIVLADPTSNESNNVDDSSEVAEVAHHNGVARSLIGQDDVKPSIFDIFNMLPSASRMRRSREMMDVAMIKEEVEEEQPEITYNRLGHHHHRRRRTSSNCPETRTGRESETTRVANGNCSQATGSVSPMRPDDDQNQLHTQMLVDTLIKESRLFRCEPCNILFPEYGMYVLHLGCHGNDGAYQCHFCQLSFDNRFSFATHFIRCPHDESRCQ